MDTPAKHKTAYSSHRVLEKSSMKNDLSCCHVNDICCNIIQLKVCREKIRYLLYWIFSKLLELTELRNSRRRVVNKINYYNMLKMHRVMLRATHHSVNHANITHESK